MPGATESQIGQKQKRRHAGLNEQKQTRHRPVFFLLRALRF
jgi:hypothetical protein